MVRNLIDGGGPVSELTVLEHICVDIINRADELLLDDFLILW